MMNRKFKDLKPKSIETLRAHITFWSLADFDLNLSIDHKHEIETTGVNRYLAEYAITYAVLLDDKELTKDLCQNGARLDIMDSWTSNKTPLELAIEYGRAEVATILIQYGAKLKKEVKVPSSNPCSNPLTFFWTLKESANNRQADYAAINRLLHRNKIN